LWQKISDKAGMERPNETPLQLLAHSAKLKMFVMLRRTLDRALLRENLGAHLRWMIDAESRGSIFLSGPVSGGDGSTQLDGLTIIRAPDAAAATQLANEDPLVRIQAVAFEIHEWTINEGSISLAVSLSDSSVRFS
jgi:uncharacterized protein YciI